MRNILMICVLFSCSVVSAQVSKSDAKKWRKDLLALHEALKVRHVDLYHSTSKESLDSVVHCLYEDMPVLHTNQILVRFSQILAMIGDGHTSFFPGIQKKKWFGFFPMKFWSFPDGIYVISTTEKYKEFLGQKLLQIDHTPIEEVFRKISTTIGADNDMEFVYSVPFSIPRPELLHVLGITDSDQKAEFHFEQGSTTLFSIGRKEWQNETYICANGVFPDGKSPSQRLEFLFASSLTLDSLKQRRYYWFTHLEEENVLFLQYNQCWNQKARPSFSAIISELFDKLDASMAERLIIDLRQNSGGEPLIATPLIQELEKRKTYLEQGRVFVLVGRRTFSAALTNAIDLRKIGARIVGEAPRGKPNNPSEGRDIDLKSKKIWATVSTQFLLRDASLGEQDYLPLDITCALSFNDYQNGRDIVLEEALRTSLF